MLIILLGLLKLMFRKNEYTYDLSEKKFLSNPHHTIMSWLFGLNKNDPIPMEAPQVRVIQPIKTK